jgi:hypothetical protein
VRVICRGVQRDVVKDLPTHVDFMRLRRTSKVNLFIPVEFVNHEEAPGLKRGGVLTVVRPEVELIVVAGEIPDHITADLSGRNIGDVIHISDIPLPEGVKPTIDRDFVIANITAPSGLVSSDNAAEGEEAARRRGGRRGLIRHPAGTVVKTTRGRHTEQVWRPLPFCGSSIAVATVLPHPPEAEDLAARHRRVIGHRHRRHRIDDAFDRARRVVAGMQLKHAEAQRAFPRTIEQMHLRAFDIHQNHMRPMRAQQVVKSRSSERRRPARLPRRGAMRESDPEREICRRLTFLRAGHDRTVQGRSHPAPRCARDCLRSPG